MIAEFLVDAEGKKSSLGTRSIRFGFKVTISYSDGLTLRSLVSPIEITMNLLGCVS